jgi:hypothetical protein
MNCRVIHVISGAILSIYIREGSGEQLPPPRNHC